MLVLAASLMAFNVNAQEEELNTVSVAPVAHEMDAEAKELYVSIESGDMQRVQKLDDVVQKTIVNKGDFEKVFNLTLADLNSTRYQTLVRVYKKSKKSWIVNNKYESVLFNNTSINYSNMVQMPVVSGVDFDKEDKSAELTMGELRYGESLFFAINKPKDSKKLLLTYQVSLTKLDKLSKVAIKDTRYAVDTPGLKTDVVFSTTNINLNEDVVLFETDTDKVVIKVKEKFIPKSEGELESYSEKN